MFVPGAYFRDETIWRGKMLEFKCQLKATLYEFGFWIGALYLAFPLSKWIANASLLAGIASCMRMLFGYLDEIQGGRRIDKDIERYFDEAFSGD